MRFIHEPDNRSVCCILLGIGRHLLVRFIRPKKALTRPDPQTFDRRRGFSNRATGVMFGATVINFLFSSLNTGNQLAQFIVFIQKALILPERSELTDALLSTNIINFWSRYLPVSSNLFLPNSVPNIMVGEDIIQRSHRHLEGLGPCSR